MALMGEAGRVGRQSTATLVGDVIGDKNLAGEGGNRGWAGSRRRTMTEEAVDGKTD